MVMLDSGGMLTPEELATTCSSFCCIMCITNQPTKQEPKRRVAMATEFVVTVENRPGTLGDIAQALGNAGVNIEGIQGMPCEGWGVIHMMVNNDEGAQKALDAAGVRYTTREVLLLNLPNEPDALGRVARTMGQAQINIDAVYSTASGQVVLGVDDLTGAQEVASNLGVL